MDQLFSDLLQAVATALGAVITFLVAHYAPRAIAAFETRTGIQLSDQQRAAVLNAAQTQAGIVETMIQQGAIKLADVTPTSPAMIDHAKQALARVPNAAAAQGTTPVAMAAIIVGKADTVSAASARPAGA
jgi:hypothetical protein